MQYGLIGNCKSAALIGIDGTIEWCCLPRFDSPSAFGRLLGPNGGHFAIQLPGATRVEQSYLPDTNILKTELDDGTNACVIIDYMPRFREGLTHRHPAELHRLVQPLRGTPAIRVEFHPALNYAHGHTELTVRHDLIVATHEVEDLYLYSSLPTEAIAQHATIPLTTDAYFVVSYHERITQPTRAEIMAAFEFTKRYWEDWSGHCRLPTAYRDAVLRSALMLKLMTYEETGAIIAAPTTSLPEDLQSARTWDYRYCWLRDASLLLEALKSIGHFAEARAFIHFLLNVFESKQTRVQIMYGIDGRTELPEQELPHLQGFRGRGPVRIGNAASRQQQNDIFGEVLNTLYLYYGHYQFEPLTDEVWSLAKFFVNTIARDWGLEDAGIWEYRTRVAHHTFSKFLSWVAIDRGIAMARTVGNHAMMTKWQPLAAAIRHDIEQHAWSAELGTFVHSYLGREVDASLLLMQRYGFLSRDDPRWQSTVRYCARHLLRQQYGFRYIHADHLGTPQTAFIIATLWIAKALDSIGERAQAEAIFTNLLARANHVGLLSEGIDPATGALCGNFPQAYSHMAVITTAMQLNKGTTT